MCYLSSLFGTRPPSQIFTVGKYIWAAGGSCEGVAGKLELTATLTEVCGEMAWRFAFLSLFFKWKEDLGSPKRPQIGVFI